MGNYSIPVQFVISTLCIMCICVYGIFLSTRTDAAAKKPVPSDAYHIVLHSEGKEQDPVRHTMNVPNPETPLSGITSINGDKAIVEIFGSITDVEPRSLWKDTKILKERFGITEIDMFINSGGGSAADGLSLADVILKSRKEEFKIEAYATGKCASAAVVILAVADKRVASPGCMFMVHKAKISKTYTQEDINDLKAQQEMMALLRARYLQILADNSKLTVDQWRTLLEKTKWFTSEQAFEWGLVDEIR